MIQCCMRWLLKRNQMRRIKEVSAHLAAGQVVDVSDSEMPGNHTRVAEDEAPKASQPADKKLRIHAKATQPFRAGAA
mgnify:CR=1 FL=1